MLRAVGACHSRKYASAGAAESPPDDPHRNEDARTWMVWVLEEDAVVVAIIVLLPAPNYLLLDNIAVSPARHGSGLGRRLPASRCKAKLRSA